MKKYTVGFKHQAVMHYYRIRSRQLTAETFRMARTHLRRRIATSKYYEITHVWPLLALVSSINLLLIAFPPT